MIMKSVNIKPCPFCGSKRIYREIGPSHKCLRCHGCCASGGFVFRHETEGAEPVRYNWGTVRHRWNTRMKLEEI